MNGVRALIASGLLLAAFVVAGPQVALPYDALALAQVIATPEMPAPGYLQEVIDPVFGTHAVRVTDPGGPMRAGMSCTSAYCTHRYSSSQAWNANQSLLLVTNGCSGFCFLDGRSYAPLFHRAMPDECEWHPVDADVMICVGPRAIYQWRPRSDVKTVVFAAGDYRDLQFGPYKGNPSQDGNRLVVRAKAPTGQQVAFAYDLATKTKYPDIRLADLPGRNGYCGISPSGRYVLCTQQLASGTEEAVVFTVEGQQLQHWTDHHRPGHGDMTIDADGNDVYVGISKDNPDKFHIIKRRLIDGAVTDLAPYGEGQHASLRSIARPGWVFLSYAGDFAGVSGRRGFAPFYQEVVALRIDGSGELRRIAQTRNARHDYWSETHASPSPDGSQVIWSSNWGRAGGPVADYVTRLAWPQAPPGRSSMRE